MIPDHEKTLTYSVSLVTQGNHKFYTLSMPSEVLAQCSTVDTREDDPIRGFQRRLDEKRADEIAEYIDEGLGTIPSSIVLSAQAGAELTYKRERRSITFRVTPSSFLILDGQHRVFGFSKAKKTLRVPVVIYNNLTRPRMQVVYRH
ncbi:MAG: DGQHR domain-containing protein [Sandaracinaceae bacterium]|nr:DGQHR domain-containing protein [Sandaracinaceae bacterium]